MNLAKSLALVTCVTAFGCGDDPAAPSVDGGAKGAAAPSTSSPVANGRPDAGADADADAAVAQTPTFVRPFADSSSWNTPIAAGAKYTALTWPKSSGYNYWVNWDGYSPAIQRSTPDAPLVQVETPASWGWPAGVVSMRIPSGATGAKGKDGEILVIDGENVHNMWQFQRTGDTTGKCSAYARASLTASGWGQKSPFLGAGIVATGSSQLAGLLVQAETDAGEIEHALQIVLDAPLQKPGSTGEAINGDGQSANGISTEGERLALPSNMPMPTGLSPLGAKVFRALVKYGAFNIDTSYGTTLLRAQANAFDAATIDALRKDVNTFMPALQRVD